ncbi:MAG: hypothetical protein M1827_003576 [Pycnora praestabilis]|nr:MAG: hypothetical protein M1827_003576 [Pycnora praestabilis]
MAKTLLADEFTDALTRIERLSTITIEPDGENVPDLFTILYYEIIAPNRGLELTDHDKAKDSIDRNESRIHSSVTGSISSSINHREQSPICDQQRALSRVKEMQSYNENSEAVSSSYSREPIGACAIINGSKTPVSTQKFQRNQKNPDYDFSDEDDEFGVGQMPASMVAQSIQLESAPRALTRVIPTKKRGRPKKSMIVILKSEQLKTLPV